MVTDAEQVNEAVDWFALRGYGIAIEWRDRTDSLPRKYRRRGKGYWVDLVNLRTGEVFAPNYESGPTDPLAIIGAEQRYLVEEGDDRPAAPGKTYRDKAEERLRRGREETMSPPSGPPHSVGAMLQHQYGKVGLHPEFARVNSRF